MVSRGATETVFASSFARLNAKLRLELRAQVSECTDNGFVLNTLLVLNASKYSFAPCMDLFLDPTAKIRYVARYSRSLPLDGHARVEITQGGCNLSTNIETQFAASFCYGRGEALRGHV
jgi:hypothetical protein